MYSHSRLTTRQTVKNLSRRHWAGRSVGSATSALSIAASANSGRCCVNIDSQGVILKGCDVVAYFKQRKPVKGDPAIKSLYQGATYLFASGANKADFDKDPAKYVPQYGGFCCRAPAGHPMSGPWQWGVSPFCQSLSSPWQAPRPIDLLKRWSCLFPTLDREQLAVHSRLHSTLS